MSNKRHTASTTVNFRDWILGTGKFSEESLKKARDEFFTKLGKHWSEPMLASVKKAFSDHDASPDARASLPTADHAVCRGRGSGCGAGKQPAPPSVETDGFSSSSSSDPINRNAERESPRRECGESSLRDVPQLDNSRAAGGPEPSFSDRSKPIKDDLSDRSKPVALAVTVGGVDRPVSYAETDQNRIFYGTKRDTTQLRNGALSGCETVPDPDSRVWETPCTSSPQATPKQGSVQGEGSVPDSRNATEPVAWAVAIGGGNTLEATFCGPEAREEAIEWCHPTSADRPVPLYRRPQPTLTDEEREAVEAAVNFCELTDKPLPRSEQIIALRKMLERLG